MRQKDTKWASCCAAGQFSRGKGLGGLLCPGQAETKVVVAITGRVVVPRPAATDAVGARCRLPGLDIGSKTFTCCEKKKKSAM